MAKKKIEEDEIDSNELKTLPPVIKGKTEDVESEKSKDELKELDQVLPFHREMEIINKQPVRKGLENVVIDTTEICAVDGWTGELYFRGYNIYDLVENSSFEEVAYLLIYGKLPNKTELEVFKLQLITEREIPKEVLSILLSFPREQSTRIELLRTAISALAIYDPDDHVYTEEANIRKGLRIIARIPTILAYSHRIKTGKSLIPPSDEYSHAGNFYYMMTNKTPTPKIEEAFDKLLICQAEHDVNASTLSARVTVSTLSDIYSAVTSAIGTLRGPLHGGANERVINYLITEIKTLDNTIPWLESKLKNKEKIIGFGHRVYKTWDPRTIILKKLDAEFWKDWNKEHHDHYHENLFEIQLLMEDYMIKNKNLYPNVDFYSASLLHVLGVPSPLFTPIFAASRAAGWLAHSLEQLRDNRILRPRLRYMGEIGKKYVNINER